MTTGTTTTTSKPSIGPGALQPQGTDPFLLSKPEMVLVQTYVEAGTRLPASRADMQAKLGIAASDVDQFDDLIGAYKNTYDHCSYFKTVTFPMSVGLASDIVAYNVKVPIYYGALNTIILQWQAGTLSDEDAKKKFQLIFTNLRNQAQTFSDSAKDVKQKMIDFVEETKADQGFLQPIQTRYKAKYESQGGVIDTFTKEITNDNNQITFWNDQYSHDVIVAATTPTYAWVFPIGTIAAGIVAGIYGKKATDALDNVHDYQNKLAQAEDGLRQALILKHDLDLANSSLDGILAALNAALPVLEKMEGIWGALADDLGNIVTQILDNDIGKADVLIKDLGVAEAISAWAAVSKLADNYRLSAYITVKTEADIKAAA